MKGQATLDLYFKCKSTRPPPITGTMSDKKAKKRRSLSLIKTSTPEKSPKTNHSNVGAKTKSEVVNLCSDEDSPPISTNNILSQNSIMSEASNSSNATIIYNLTPSTPQRNQPGPRNDFQSPQSGQKFYSPSKKRALYKKSTVKRNLAEEYDENVSQSVSSTVEDVDFNKAYREMDDKSIFFITIIIKCLKDDSLRQLLDDKSQKLLSSCLQIMKPGIKLVCRLYWYQHIWYRKEKLAQIIHGKKKPISNDDFEQMLYCLIEHGLITASSGPGMGFNDLTKVLKSDELIQICKDFKINRKSKVDAAKALSDFCRKTSIMKYFNGNRSTNEERVLETMTSAAGTCYKLTDSAIKAFYKLYVLMYLGINEDIIRDKKLELLLINNKANRETFPINNCMELDNASVVFRNREEFQKYMNAKIVYERYLDETKTEEKCRITLEVYNEYKKIVQVEMNRYKALPTWLRRYTPAYIYAKIMESGVQELKKDKNVTYYEEAVDILTTLISQLAFRQHKKAEWYAEKALILQKRLARHDEACKVILEGLNSDMSDEAKDVLRSRADKLDVHGSEQYALIEQAIKELKRENSIPADHILKQHMENSNSNGRGKKIFEVHTEEGRKFVDAENYCIIHYTTNGQYTHGGHWEGRIVTTIFFLLFWDIIYTKPPGVRGIFLSHYQRFPLDMFCESFYINRKALIDEYLSSIETMSTGMLIDIMQHKWNERQECENSGINRSIQWDSVRMVTQCLGARGAAAVCRRLAAAHGHTHCGFPDLTLWNIHTGKIKFVEVKTDTDKPSIKQLQWMIYLRDNGIDTGFCYVGVNTTRCKARVRETETVLKNNVKKSDKSQSVAKKSTKVNTTPSRNKSTAHSSPTVNSVPDSNECVAQSGTKVNNDINSNTNVVESGTKVNSVTDSNECVAQSGTKVNSVTDSNTNVVQSGTKINTVTDSNKCVAQFGTKVNSVLDSNKCVAQSGTKVNSVTDSNTNVVQSGTKTNTVTDSNKCVAQSGTKVNSVTDSNTNVVQSGTKTNTVTDSNKCVAQSGTKVNSVLDNRKSNQKSQIKVKSVSDINKVVELPTAYREVDSVVHSVIKELELCYRKKTS